MINLKTFGFTLFLLLLYACGSFDPNNKIEVERYPDPNYGEKDLKTQIDRSLRTMYPHIGKYVLENEPDGNKADFYLGGSSFRVTFDSLGNWKKTKVTIQFTRSINERVKKAIRLSDFRDWHLVKKELNEKPGEIEYEFSFRKDDELYEVKYSGEGLLTKMERSTIQYVK